MEDYKEQDELFNRMEGAHCKNADQYKSSTEYDIKTNDRVLLINDMAGYGKVALSAMIPVMSHMGFTLHNLPTALVSNTLDYGKFDILETTAYMKNTLRVWEDLGFSFDAVATGFIVSEEQVRLVAEYCRTQKERGAHIFVDPIMGDDGKLYNGVTEATIAYMRKLCSVADIIMPNFTEAAFLAARYEEKTVVTPNEAELLVHDLRELGAKSVVITSVNVMGENCVFGYDDQMKKMFQIPFDYIPVRFPGTGDIFSAVLVGNVLRGTPLESAVDKAMKVVRNLILKNKENIDKNKGIPIEKYLNEIECPL